LVAAPGAAQRGLDRILFRRHLTRLNFPEGVAGFLPHQGVLLEHFRDSARVLTGMIREAAAAITQAMGRPVRYLRFSATRKADVAKRIQAEHPCAGGLLRLLTCVEPCMTWHVHRRCRPAKGAT
jgi:hypothetical protein